tara:strand:+ start:59 stop:523 length:465 start_codon:yes stop_codon:yes gene_type:complete
MPETKLATADYLQLFASWRNDNHDPTTSSWSAIGKDFLAVVNSAIKKAGNVGYASTAEGYDSLRAKHNSTRVKYKKTLRKPVEMGFSIVEWISHGPGKPSTPVMNHLDAEGRNAFMVAMGEVDNKVSQKMPGLPSYEMKSRGGLTGDQMDDLLD